MDRESEELLKELCPGLEIPKSSKAWITRSNKALAKTTHTRDVYPVVDHTRGEGPWVYDLQGNQYIDVTAGVGVRALGFRHPGIIDYERRIQEFIREVPGQDFDVIPQTILAERLAAIAPGTHEKKVFFTTSGGRAVEAAVKSLIDTKHRHRFVAFRPAFHGRTGYSLALTASKHVHKDFYPQGLDVVRSPYPYCYRCPFGQKEEECDLECARYLRDSIQYEGTDIAGIVFEPICGEGGILPAPGKFVRELRKIADEVGAGLVSDEVQAGLGRSGLWWSIEHSNVVPDYICSAKALGVGFAFAACIGPAPMYTDWGRHSETFGAEPYVALLSLAQLHIIVRDGLLENVRNRSKQLLSGLRDIQGGSRIIGDVRGLGLMCAVEIVSSRDKMKENIDLRNTLLNNCVKKHGLWIIGAGRNCLRFLPSLNITAEQIDIILERFGNAVKDTG
ncbi:MAG: aspartate aminotransferase family protein [Promethearchaeota archaeon]